MERERLKGNLDLLLLSVLSSGPAHGYAIISALRDRSGGTFDLPEGTIYPALHRLEDSGLLVSTWDRAHRLPGRRPSSRLRLSQDGRPEALQGLGLVVDGNRLTPAEALDLGSRQAGTMPV